MRKNNGYIEKNIQISLKKRKNISENIKNYNNDNKQHFFVKNCIK